MDFISNGFQQLFAELEDNLEICDYDIDYSNQQQFQNDSSTIIEFNNINNSNINNNSYYYNCDYYSYVDNQEPPDLDSLFLTNDFGKTFDQQQIDQYEFNNNNLNYIQLNEESSTTKCEKLQHQQHNNNNNNINQNIDIDWEKQFLDNYIEIPELTNLLPDKTPFCSDSCDLVLKESSENLKKFHYKFNLDILNNNNNNNKYQPSISDECDNGSNSSNCGEKLTFPCTWDMCNKVYAKPAHLKAHLRRHIGDKPYVCTWPNCTWKFSRSDELARHKRSHSGIKPFQCIYCPKCFARSDHLAKHRKVHERKMAASRLKGIFIPNLHHVRPGRKPKGSVEI